MTDDPTVAIILKRSYLIPNEIRPPITFKPSQKTRRRTLRMKLYIPVLLGTTRIERQSIRVARFILRTFGAYETVNTELIDLAQYAIPPLEQRLSQMSDPPSGLRDFGETMRRADGLLIVAPEYKNAYPGVLKNAFDYLEKDVFRYKPIGICTVSSGRFGGMQCLTQLRLVCLAMGGLPIPAKLPISNVQDVFDPDGAPRDPSLEEKRDAFLGELLWYTEAVVNQRKKAEKIAR